MDKAIEIFKTLIRPGITVFLLGLLAYVVITAPRYDPEVLGYVLNSLFILNIITLTFWFGDRALQRLGFNFGTMLNRKKPDTQETPPQSPIHNDSEYTEPK